MSRVTRRDVLRGVGNTTAFGMLAASLPGHVGAAQEATAEESAICLSMLFPNGKKARFDGDRYRDKHLPLIRSIYGDSVERIELRVAPPPPRAQSGFPSPPPAFLAAANIWIRNVDEFGKRTAENGQQIQADLQKVSPVTPYVQYDQTIALMGDARSDVQVGTDCFSTYFPGREGGKWDAKYYVEQYLPKLVAAYGKNSIRRIEVGRGTAGQGGAKAAMVSGSHLYIRDRQSFDAAGMKAGMQLFQETPNYTNIMALFGFMKVHAAG